MKFGLQITFLILTLSSCSHGLFRKNDEKEIDYHSEKLEFTEFIKQRYSRNKIYLADSTTKDDMWRLLENWNQLELIYADIDTLVEQSSGFSFLKHGLTAENLELRKVLCQAKGICSLKQELELTKDSVMFISEPQVYLLSDKPVVFLVAKEFKPKTIKLKEGDTTLLTSKFHLWSAILDSNEWKGKMTIDLN